MRNWALKSKSKGEVNLSMCERNGSELIYPGCQQRESTDPLLFGAWIVAQGCWQLHGGPRNPVSNDQAQSLNLGLKTGHFSHSGSDIRSVSPSPTFPVSAFTFLRSCLKLPPPLSTFHAMASFTCPLTYPVLSWGLFFKMLIPDTKILIILPPVNSQANKSNARSAPSAYFSRAPTHILNSVAVLWH